LLAASAAFPDAAGLEKADILALAVRANSAIHPSQRGHKLNAYINIGEVPDNFNEAVRNVLACHELIVAKYSWCVKYIYAPRMLLIGNGLGGFGA
jgi:hypothetical protein